MGVGTNVQARAVALWHMDCPWRPADLAQRDGRILRQGNQNEEIAIVRFVTERSFDAFMWQTIERKATFIAQVMRGRLDSREIDEIDPGALSAAEAKALSSGNPLLLEHSTLTSEVAKLRRLQRAHERNQNMLTHTERRADEEIARFTEHIAALETAVPLVTDTSGDRFRITLDGRNYTSRADAAGALERWMQANRLQWMPTYRGQEYGVIGNISGFDIEVRTSPGMGILNVTTSLVGVPRSSFTLTQREFLVGGVGLVQRIENRVSAIPALVTHVHEDLDKAERAKAEATQRIGQPFKHAQALDEAEKQLAAVETALAAMQEEDRETPGNPARAPAPVTVETLRDHIPPVKRVLPRTSADRENDRRVLPSPHQSQPAYEPPSL